MSAPECLEAGPDCHGPIKWWADPHGSGKAFPRCEFHLEKRIEQARITAARYPELPPADFDPAYAGEKWDED